MKIKAQYQDEQVSGYYAAFYDFCDAMKWERFKPSGADFIHNGWRVSIEHEVGYNIFVPCYRPNLQSSMQRITKNRQRYTESLRPFNKACKQCKWLKGNTCSIGIFKVKQGGGCVKFVER